MLARQGRRRRCVQNMLPHPPVRARPLLSAHQSLPVRGFSVVGYAPYVCLNEAGEPLLYTRPSQPHHVEPCITSHTVCPLCLCHVGHGQSLILSLSLPLLSPVLSLILVSQPCHAVSALLLLPSPCGCFPYIPAQSAPHAPFTPHPSHAYDQQPKLALANYCCLPVHCSTSSITRSLGGH